jgi:hypothetical protein
MTFAPFEPHPFDLAKEWLRVRRSVRSSPRTGVGCLSFLPDSFLGGETRYCS